MGRAPQNIALAVLAVLIAACVAQRRPPNYSLDDMPSTSFDCRDKSIGGYYADPEADCQMFHVCVRLSNNEVQDFRFLCPNDTMFDQENQICANWFDIDCEANAEFYAKGFDLLRVGHGIANDDLLQKTPLVPERRLPPVNRQRDQEQDLFRGSSSSDIHRGRDEEDEEFERQNKKKAKVSVRRKQQQQNRNRRPITTTVRPEDFTTELPENFRSDQSVPEYTNINRQRTSTRVTPIPSSTTVQQQSTQQQTTQQRNNNFQINVPNKQQEFQQQRGQQRNFQNAAPTGNDFQRTSQRNNAPNNNEFQRNQQRNNQGSTTAPGNNDFQRNNANNDFQRNNAPNNNEFQRNQQRNNQGSTTASGNNDFQRNNANNDFQRNNAPNNNEFQRNQQRNNQGSTTASGNNDFQRNNANNNDFQRNQQRNNFQTSAPSAPGDVPRTQPRPSNNNDFQRNPQRNNFQQQPQQQQSANNNDFQRRGNFRGQQRHQVTAAQNNVQSTTFEATTAPTRSTTYYDNPTSLTPTYVSDFTSSSVSQSFPSSTIAPTTYSRQNDQQFNPSTISPTTYNAFQQRKNLQRKNFPSTASPNSISNAPQRFSSTPAPSFQQSISPSQQSFTNDVTSRPIVNNNNFVPTTYRPRAQNNVPQPFQQSRRAQRPRDDFVNDNSEELLKTAHSSSFRASDLNAIQKSSVNYPSTTSSPFPPPSSPRTFTVPRQQQQQNRQQQQRPTEAPQQFNKQFFNNNASPNSQFTNNPSSQTPFVNPSTAQPNNFFTGSTQDHSQNNFFTASTPKPFNQNSNFNANQNNNNNFNANQNNNNNFNANQNFNSNRNNNFNANSNQNNNAFTSSSPKPNNNNQNGFTATPKSNNFNNNNSPTQNGFAATSPKPQRPNNQFNTQAPRDNSNNNFFNPSTARPVNNQFTGNVVSSTPQPFSQKQAFVPSTPQPFQQRASSFTQPPQQQSTPEDDGKPKKNNKKANSDYDYAYYDDTPIDDYEGIEHISEFTKTHKG